MLTYGADTLVTTNKCTYIVIQAPRNNLQGKILNYSMHDPLHVMHAKCMWEHPGLGPVTLVVLGPRLSS